MPAPSNSTSCNTASEKSAESKSPPTNSTPLIEQLRSDPPRRLTFSSFLGLLAASERSARSIRYRPRRLNSFIASSRGVSARNVAFLVVLSLKLTQLAVEDINDIAMTAHIL